MIAKTIGAAGQKDFFKWSGIFFTLFAVWIILHLSIIGLKKKIAFDKTQLSGLQNQNSAQLRVDIKDLNASLSKLESVLDNKKRWLVKDYDMSIYFVEELNKANIALKNKAGQKKVDFPSFVFQEQLPSEAEAILYLNQLYGLREVVNLGLDYGVSFTSVIPEEIGRETKVKLEPKDAKEAKGVKQAKEVSEDEVIGAKVIRCRLELVCPAQALVEFIIQLNSLVPKVFFELLAIKSEGETFKVSLMINQLVMDLEWKTGEELPEAEPDIALSKPAAAIVDGLRAASPFLLPPKKEPKPPEAGDTESPQQLKPVIRFYYRGKAMLKGKEVALVEDAKNQETAFLAPGDRIAEFTMQEFNEDKVVLKNSQSSEELVVKKQELDNAE
ncbi:MAG: hypothetical protein WC628_05865 [Candidatus Omnitrophota bacterium]